MRNANRGSFKRGQLSANPKGRPKGIVDTRSAFRSLLEPQAPQSVAKAVEMALAVYAAVLCLTLGLIIPGPNPKDDPVRLPPAGGSLADKGAAGLKALGDGEIAPDTASVVLKGIASKARIVEGERSSGGSRRSRRL